jgi:elongation factor P
MAMTENLFQGQTIKYNNEIWVIISKEFAAMGKGSSFNRCKLKNLLTGKVIPITFKDGDKVEEIDVEKQTVQFLYDDGKMGFFMNPDTFEQIEFPLDDIAGRADFLHTEARYIASKYQGMIISIQLPIKIVLAVTETSAGVKGNTVNNTYKDAIMETGAKIQVPLFIQIGDKISINTEEVSYVSKA